MAEVIKTTKYVVDLSGVPCPACGRSDHWDSMVHVESNDNNQELHVGCDCGMGEVVVVVE